MRVRAGQPRNDKQPTSLAYFPLEKIVRICNDEIALLRLRYIIVLGIMYNEQIHTQLSIPPMQNKTPTACPMNNFDTLSCTNTKRHAEQEGRCAKGLTKLRMVSCSNSTFLPPDILKTNVSCVFTAGLIHPTGPSFAESGAVMMVSTRHAFALATLNPLFINVMIDALEVQSQ